MCGLTAEVVGAARAKTYRIFLLLIGICKTHFNICLNKMFVYHIPLQYGMTFLT